MVLRKQPAGVAKSIRTESTNIAERYDNMKRRIACIFITIILTFSFLGCSTPGKNHNDGKCDICGKSASYSDGDEEYCNEHFKDAVQWYINQGKN